MKTNLKKKKIQATAHQTSTLQLMYKCETGKGSIRTYDTVEEKAGHACFVSSLYGSWLGQIRGIHSILRSNVMSKRFRIGLQTDH